MDTCALFEKINGLDEQAASALKKADLTSDADLQVLTHEDLRELLPGVNVKRRRLISNIIHEQKPIDVLIKQPKEFIPNETLRASLSPSGVLVDDLSVEHLKHLKNQINEVLDAHIGLLEERIRSHPHQEQDKGASSSTSLPSGSMELHNSQTSNSSQTAGGRGSSISNFSISLPKALNRFSQQKTQAKLAVKMVVSGKTFDAHSQLLDKVKTSGEPDLILDEQEDSQVAIVFCPVVSRVGTDAEAALSKVTGNETVILVLMHHTHTVKAVTSMNQWNNVVLCVNVFYHETVPGLLQCQENNAAIAKIRQELMIRSVRTPESISGKAENESKSWFPWKY